MSRGAVLAVAIAVWLCAAGSGIAEEEEEPFVFVLEEAPVELTTPASEIELGFLWGSDHSFKFGDFTGLQDRGFSVLGNVDILRRSPYDSETARYLRLRGLNLGLDSRSVDAAVGEQGLFGLSFLFHELPKFQTDSARTFFLGTGGTNLTLPPLWVRGHTPDPADMTQLNASLRRLEVDHKRRRLGGTASLVLPMNMEFETRYVHETKKGEKLMGAVIGSSGGNPRAVILPQELDYTTHQVDAKLRFAREDLQLQLQYYGSGFDNENNSVTWENPYLAHQDWDPDGVSGPNDEGRKGQPPDNWFHQVSASGGYNLPLNTRVTLNAGLGWMLQNDDFLPFTVNPALGCDGGGTAPCPLPRDSLDGEIKTRLVDLRASSRPLPRLRLNLGYRFDDRDNDTPRDVYQYIAGDAADQEGITNSRSRINRPYSLERHEVKFDAGYQIFTRTNLTLGYEWERTERDFQEVEELDEHTLKVKLHARPWSILSAGANYERSWRNGSTYNGVNPQLAGESPESLVGFDPATDWENHPLLRKYYLADRERDDVRFFTTLMPFEDLNVGVNLGYVRDDYGKSELGLTRYSILSSGVDLSYSPMERVATHAFYTFERIRAVQNGWSFGFAKAAESVNPDRRWTSRDKDRAHTAGFGLTLDVVPDRLGFGADYVFSKTRGKIAMGLGAALLDDPPQPAFPEVKSRLHTLNVHADYQLTTNLSVRVGYLFEDFKSSDWALDGVNPGTLSDRIGQPNGRGVIATGENSPDYSAHVVAWSLVFKFW